MDKFGIFKLLSMLGNFNPTDSAANPVPDDAPVADAPASAPPKAAEPPRLTSPLLETANRHDEFVKRVLKNKPPKQ